MGETASRTPTSTLRMLLGMKNDAIQLPTTSAITEARRTEPTCHVCPACLISRASPSTPGRCRIRLSTAGLELSGSCLRIVVPSGLTPNPRLSNTCEMLLNRRLNLGWFQEIQQYPEAGDEQQNEQKYRSHSDFLSTRRLTNVRTTKLER